MQTSVAIAAHVLLCQLASAVPGPTLGDPQASPPSTSNKGCAPSSSLLADDRTTPDDSGKPRSANEWPRLTIHDPLAALAIRRALDEASRRLAAPRCQALLTQFHDANGRLLAERLEEIGIDIQKYLRLILFHERIQDYCRDGVAYTVPGSRVVFVCPSAVERHWHGNWRHLVITIIHEVLHTLGLNEDPPSSAEINRRVRQACY